MNMLVYPMYSGGSNVRAGSCEVFLTFKISDPQEKVAHPMSSKQNGYTSFFFFYEFSQLSIERVILKNIINKIS